MTALTICMNRDWARPLPGDRYFFAEAEDIFTKKNEISRLYSHERVACVDLTQEGSWEWTLSRTYHLETDYSSDEELIQKHSLYHQKIKEYENKWRMLAPIIQKRMAKVCAFHRWVAQTCPQKTTLPNKVRKFAHKRIRRRAFTAWASWVHPPTESGRWSSFYQSATKDVLRGGVWTIENDVGVHASVIARSYAPYHKNISRNREICYKCGEKSARSGTIYFYHCGHGIHETCFPARNDGTNRCHLCDDAVYEQMPPSTIQEAKSLGGFSPLPSSSTLQVGIPMAVLDHVVYVAVEGGHLWRLDADEWFGVERTVRLSELMCRDGIYGPIAESKGNLWSVIKYASRWRRKAMCTMERHVMAAGFIFTHLTQIAWNEYAQEMQTHYMRLSRIPGLRDWRQNVGILAHLVEEFCNIFEKPSREVDDDNKMWIHTDFKTFEKIFKQMYRLYNLIFGKERESYWMKQLERHAKGKQFEGLMKAQTRFAAHIRELVYHIEAGLLMGNMRFNTDRALDTKQFSMTFWSITFYKIGFAFLPRVEQESCMYFVNRLRQAIDQSMNKTRYAFRFNSQTCFYKPARKTPEEVNVKDDIVYQVAEITDFHVSQNHQARIHFVTIGLDKMVAKLEHMTQLPLVRWIRTVVSS